MLTRLSNWRTGASSTRGQIFNRGSTYRILWTFGLDPAGAIVCRFRSYPTAEATVNSVLPGAWTPVLQNGKTYPFAAQSLTALYELNASRAAEMANMEAAAAEAAAGGLSPTDADAVAAGFSAVATPPVGAGPISIFDKRLRVAPWTTRAYKAAFFAYWTCVSFTAFCLYWIVKQRLLNAKAREVVTSLEKVGSSVVVGAIVAPVTFAASEGASERCRNVVQNAVRSVTGTFFSAAQKLGCYSAEQQEHDEVVAMKKREARAKARGQSGAAHAAASAKPSTQQEWLESGGARLLLSAAICLLLGYTVF